MSRQNQHPPLGDLVSRKQAAAARGVVVATIRKWEENGKLPRAATIDTKPLYRLADVMAVRPKTTRNRRTHAELIAAGDCNCKRCRPLTWGG